MQEVSVVIPNFNGMAYLDGVLSSLERQTIRNFEVILVDNGSTDGSCAFVSAEYPWVHMIQLPENYGFSRAVNEGIHAARSPYVLLLNNDTEAEPDFLEEMVAALRRHKKAFSCQAKMIQLHDHDKMDDAGNYYCALGWAFARGKDKDINHYDKEQKIFSYYDGENQPLDSVWQGYLGRIETVDGKKYDLLSTISQYSKDASDEWKEMYDTYLDVINGIRIMDGCSLTEGSHA